MLEIWVGRELSRRCTEAGRRGRTSALHGLLAALFVVVAYVQASAQTADEKLCSARNGAPAIAACTRLIQSGSAKGVVLYLHHNDRGGAYQSVGTNPDHYRAIEDFTAAAGLEPKLPYAFINRGVSWATLGAYDRAIEDFAQALRVDPKNARAHNNRGGAHRDRGEFDRAMADFNRAIALDPGLADALFNRGTVFMQKEDYTRAVADYSAVLRQNPKDILALAARGRAFSSQNDDRRAKADFEAALAATPTDRQSEAVQEAVKELLRALLEKRAAIEREAAQRRQATLDRKVEEERQAALERQAIAEKKAAERRQAALEKELAADKKTAEDRQAALEKQAATEKKDAERKQAAEKKAAERKRVADEKKAADERRVAEAREAALESEAAAERKAIEDRQAALEKKAAAELKAAEEKQAALQKKAAAELRAAEQRLAALEMKAQAERKSFEERQAALQIPPPPALVPPGDAPRVGDRMALVIGNSAYDASLGKLDNPGNDARDVAGTLHQLGFTVWLSLDLGHAQMKETLERFAAAARDATTAVVFFSGHGFQYGSSNYLAAVDAPITDDESIARHLSLDSVMAGLKAERGIRILIVDACRNNLAVEQAVSTQVATRQVAVKRGLSPVTIATTWAGGGMLVAFATLPGDVASDGAGRNSPFTHALVKHLQTPNLELRNLFIRVRAEVVAATLGRQIPQVSDALNGEYVFRVRR